MNEVTATEAIRQPEIASLRVEHDTKHERGHYHRGNLLACCRLNACKTQYKT